MAASEIFHYLIQNAKPTPLRKIDNNKRFYFVKIFLFFEMNVGKYRYFSYILLFGPYTEIS